MSDTRRFTNAQIDRLLRPKSVAVIGASDRHGALGCTLLNNLVQYEFAGDIYPVNPKRDELQGLKVVKVEPGPWEKAAQRSWPAVRGKVVPEAVFDAAVKARDEVRKARQ